MLQTGYRGGSKGGTPKFASDKQYTFNDIIYRIEIIKQFLIYFSLYNIKSVVQLHKLCILGGSHKTKTTPYHPESGGLVERFNRTLLMMLAMFAGEHKDDWDDLLPPVKMAYRSRVHESTGFSPYRLMFGEECTLPMDIGLARQDPDPQEGSRAHMLSGLRTRWRWLLIRSVVTRVRLYNDKNDFMTSGQF